MNQQQDIKMKIDIPYYEDMTRYSNSDIGYFIKYGPQGLKDYKEGKVPPLSLSVLEKGSMIHEYILQPDEFWKDYVILDFETPKVKQQKDFCEFFVKLKTTDPLASLDKLLLTAYNQAYNNKKTEAEKLKEAYLLQSTYKNYCEYLETSDTKKIISWADMKMLKNIEENIKKHKKANELLYGLPVTFESHNEFHINWYVNKFDMRCKSLLDRVCFDHINKKIILIDLKTTQNVYNFKHSVEEYDYYRQIAYYGLAIQWYMQEVLNLNSSDYSFEAYIIAIGKDANNEIRVFNMKEDSIIKYKVDLITDCLSRISYHIKTNQWEHSREYYEGDGIEEL